MNNNISIIIPIYNVEKYLKRMIESVLAQTFSDFELLLIDDGSTDNTKNICDEYKNLDNRIIVFHKKNEGAHIARNFGISKATGKYFCFFDGDDFVEKNCLYEMYNMCEKYELDLLVTGFYINTYIGNNKYQIYDYLPIDNAIYNNKNEFRKNCFKYFDNNMFYPPWNKMYSANYILNNNITFPITYRDDFPFVVSVIKNIEKIGFMQKQFYHFYREREDSETSKYYKNLYDKREEEHKMMIDLYKYWNLDNDTNSLEMIGRRYIDRLFECIVNNENKKSNLSSNEKNQLILNHLNNSNFDFSYQYAKPKSFYLKVIYFLMKNKLIFLLRLISKFIIYIKTHFNKLFSNLKYNR